MAIQISDPVGTIGEGTGWGQRLRAATTLDELTQLRREMDAALTSGTLAHGAYEAFLQGYSIMWDNITKQTGGVEPPVSPVPGGGGLPIATPTPIGDTSLPASDYWAEQEPSQAFDEYLAMQQGLTPGAKTALRKRAAAVDWAYQMQPTSIGGTEGYETLRDYLRAGKGAYTPGQVLQQFGNIGQRAGSMQGTEGDPYRQLAQTFGLPGYEDPAANARAFNAYFNPARLKINPRFRTGAAQLMTEDYDRFMAQRPSESLANYLQQRGGYYGFR